MKSFGLVLVIFTMLNSQAIAGGYSHVSCPEFVAYDAAQQVMYAKGFLAGLGAILGVLDSSRTS